MRWVCNDGLLDEVSGEWCKNWNGIKILEFESNGFPSGLSNQKQNENEEKKKISMRLKA